MKVASFLRDQDVRLGFLLDDEILEPGLACSSLAPGEEHVFRDVTLFIAPANRLLSWRHV
jgi:hypothetical protein